MFYIDRNQPLTSKIIEKMLQKFASEDYQILSKYKDYYDGNQKILKRVFEDPSKPNNRLVKNYCREVVQNYQGYIAGVPLTYLPANEDGDISLLLDVLNYNDYENADADLLKNALIYGYAPELVYIDEENQLIFKTLDPRNVVLVYSADLKEELVYSFVISPVVDWTKDDWQTRYNVDVYDSTHIYHFQCDSAFSSLVSLGEAEQHYFNEVPFSVMNIGESIFDCILSLQDAYNEILSDATNDIETFSDAYLILKNTGIDPDDLGSMRKNRALMIGDDSDIFYLTKNTNDASIQNMLGKIDEAIHTISASPDFTSDSFNSGVNSGVSIKYKLIGFDNRANSIEGAMRKAIQNRIWLLNGVFRLVDTEEVEVDIIFTENIPIDIQDIANTINTLRGIVSDETLISQLPFVNDTQAEIEKLQKQNDIYKGAFLNYGTEDIAE